MISKRSNTTFHFDGTQFKFFLSGLDIYYYRLQITYKSTTGSNHFSYVTHAIKTLIFYFFTFRLGNQAAQLPEVLLKWAKSIRRLQAESVRKEVPLEHLTLVTENLAHQPFRIRHCPRVPLLPAVTSAQPREPNRRLLPSPVRNTCPYTPTRTTGTSTTTISTNR